MRFVQRWGWPAWSLIALFFCVGNVVDGDPAEALVAGLLVVLFLALTVREWVGQRSRQQGLD